MKRRRLSRADLLQNDHIAGWQSAFGQRREPPLHLMSTDVQDDEQVRWIFERAFQLSGLHPEEFDGLFQDVGRNLPRRESGCAHSILPL
jgi:hypothetical protein